MNINKKVEEGQDYKWIQQAMKGDEKAFEALMNKHHRDVYLEIFHRIKNEEIAKDLAIEVISKAFGQLHLYEPIYPFGTWLKRVTINHTIDHLRRKKLNTTSIDEVYNYEEGELTIQLESETLNPSEVIEKKQRAAFVRSYVGKLKDVYRNLIEMRYFQELSYEEMAEQLSIPLGTVKARLHRAKSMLNQMMLNSEGAF